MMDIVKQVEGVIVIVLGALMLAEGVVSYVADLSIFFAGTNSTFVGAVGIIAVIIGGSFLEESKRK